MKEKKLIAFDMYDTFVRISKGPNLYRKFFSDVGLSNDTVKELALALQITDKNIEDMLPKNFRQKHDIDNFLLELYVAMDKQLSSLSLYEDFLPTIEKLKELGYKTAVISNLSKPYRYPLTHLVSKNIFDYNILSYEVGMQKPDRKIFDHLKEISGYGLDEIVMVGDSLKSDVQGAKNANIQPVHIHRNSQGIQYHQDYISISSLSQLLDILDIKKD